jgi:transposase
VTGASSSMVASTWRHWRGFSIFWSGDDPGSLGCSGALAAETADGTTVRSFTRRKTGRKPFPEHLPRERVVVPGPTACACCGSDRLAKIGEDVTETLEVVPRQWKVIQTVREKFTCRACESIGQPPAPFHVVARGWAGPHLLAMVLFEKYGQHQPLKRAATSCAVPCVR